MLQALWKIVWQVSKKLNIKSPYNPVIPLMDNIPKRNENICSSKNLYINMHSTTIPKNQKVETTQISVKWWTDKQNVDYSYNEVFIIQQ